MAKQLFGTDGIRGVAGEFPLDPKTVYAAGLALAERIDRGTVLIGMDTRESGPDLAELLAGGLAERGVGVEFAGVLPTAGVAHLTEKNGFAAGVMISASHNPYQDNGLKVFGPDGYKLPDAQEAEVEDRIFALLEGELEPKRERLTRDGALIEQYFEHLLDAGTTSESLRPLRVEVDCSNGAASELAERFFEALGMRAEIGAASPNGRNINRDCGSLHLDALRARVAAAGADLGIAFDGDADRALFVADDGSEIDGDVVLLLGGKHLARRGRLPGNRVVTTVMANMGLEKALNAAGLSMVRTKVGDKYVLEQMLADGSALGGEQSGHIIFKEFANTGDGLLTARMLLEILSATGEPLSALRKQLTVFPQKLVNIRVKAKPAIEEVPALAAAVRKAEDEMAGNGRIVVRYSGTEPLARVMVEAADAGLVEKHCGELGEVFQRELGL